MKVVDDLLSQEVDRKQFLIQSGRLVLALVGGTASALTQIGFGLVNNGGERDPVQVS